MGATGSVPLDARWQSGLVIAAEALGTDQIANPAATVVKRGSPDLLLLFAAGDRPDGAALRSAVQAAEGLSVSHDAAGPAGADGDEALWLELLSGGMTFDLRGIAPGSGPIVPNLRNRYGIDVDFAERSTEALMLAPGPHLWGGRSTMPVVRAQAAVAAALLRAFPSTLAVSWTPAQTLVGSRIFLSMIDAWLMGGAFPALGLTAFRQTMGSALQSEGLAFFTGQELHFDPLLFPDPGEAARIGVRLVNELVVRAPVDVAIDSAGPEGQPLTITPSPNGRFLRVGRG